MKYFFFFVFLFYSFTYALERSLSKRQIVPRVYYIYNEPELSSTEKNSREIQLEDIYSLIIKDLKDYAKPSQIQQHLDAWSILKTTEINMAVSQIDQIIVTARIMEVVASRATISYAENLGLRSSGKIQFSSLNGNENPPILQNYINAQLNHSQICNHLGIPKQALNL